MKIQPILSFLGKFSSKLGGALEPAMTLILLIERKKVPLWAWPMIAAAFAYLLNPLDAMPDPIFLDDAGVLGAAILALQPFITDDIRNEASRRIKGFFG